MALALASIGLLGGGSVCSRASAQSLIWSGRSPDSTYSEQALSQQAVSVGYGKVAMVGDAVFVTGTWEGAATKFQLRTQRYPIDPVTGQVNHLPDLEKHWPARGQPTCVANAMAVVTSGLPGNEDSRIYVVGQGPNAAGDTVIQTLAYSPNLELLWSMSYGSGAAAIPVAIAADTGRVAVAAMTWNGDPATGGYGWDMQVLLYDAQNSGQELVPPKYLTYSTHTDEWPVALRLAPDGNSVFVAGTTTNPNDGRLRFVTAGYSTTNQGSASAQQLFATTHGISGRDCYATAMAPLFSESKGQPWIYVTGFGQTSQSDADYVTYKIAGDGSEMWTDGPAVWDDPTYHLDDRAAKIAASHEVCPADGCFYIYVTGTSRSTGDGTDIVTLQYIDSSFNHPTTPTWVGRLNADAAQGAYFGSNDSPTDMAVRTLKNASTGFAQDEIFVTGWRINNHAYPSQDYVTLKYVSDPTTTSGGNAIPNWVVFYDSAAGLNDIPASIALGSFGFTGPTHTNIYVTGRSDGGASHDDFVTIRYHDDDP